MLKYTYRVKDASLITDIVENRMAAPLMRFIPLGIPSNMITILSNGCILAALVWAFLVKLEGFPVFPVIPFLIMAYTVGDIMDGKQARRTDTSSPLGEFIDHYLDAFITGLLLLIFALIWNIQNPGLIITTVIISYITHAALFYEQYRTGCLNFEKIGPIEGILFLIIFTSIRDIPILRTLLSTGFIGNISAVHLFLLFTCAGAVVTLIKSVNRVRRISPKFLIYLVLLPLTSILAAQLFSLITAFIISISFAASYIGTIQRAYLLSSNERLPDLVLPIYLGILFLFRGAADIGTAQIAATAYSFALVSTTFVSIFYPLREFWLWRNPVHEEDEEEYEVATLTS